MNFLLLVWVVWLLWLLCKFLLLLEYCWHIIQSLFICFSLFEFLIIVIIIFIHAVIALISVFLIEFIAFPHEHLISSLECLGNMLFLRLSKFFTRYFSFFIIFTNWRDALVSLRVLNVILLIVAVSRLWQVIELANHFFFTSIFSPNFLIPLSLPWFIIIFIILLGIPTPRMLLWASFSGNMSFHQIILPSSSSSPQPLANYFTNIKFNYF